MTCVEIESQFPLIVIANPLPSIDLSGLIPSFFLRRVWEYLTVSSAVDALPRTIVIVLTAVEVKTTSLST